MLIPVVFNESDARLAKLHFQKSPIVRVRQERIDDILSQLPASKLWLDCELDGCHNPPEGRADEWVTQTRKHDAGAKLIEASESGTMSKTDAMSLAESAMRLAAAKKVSWVSVPQLPIDGDAKREKLNRILADGAGDARKAGTFKGRRVLPVIFTHAEQTKGRPTRNSRIAKILKLVDAAFADVVWVCDSSLSDSDGTSTFDTHRFPDLIAFHQALKEELPGRVAIAAGPYWGISLILWARGFVDHPVAGVGRAFKYHFPGGKFPRAGAPRIAIPPLRRLVDAEPILRGWLDDAVQSLASGDPARPEFEQLRKGFSAFQANKTQAREQVASFYADWVAKIGSATGAGRAVTLYQDLSSAYVLGRQLGELPGVSGPSKRPERIAQQYMMHCL
jgi:hypothetical protein